jgi:hypothetical protein
MFDDHHNIKINSEELDYSEYSYQSEDEYFEEEIKAKR